MRAKQTKAADGLESRQANAVVGDAALLDVNEVAAMLGCSARHVYRLTDAGKMPRPVKLGSLVRWNRASIEDWIGGGCKPVRTGRGASR